jgi:hypothetical protein
MQDRYPQTPMSPGMLLAIRQIAEAWIERREAKPEASG